MNFTRNPIFIKLFGNFRAALTSHFNGKITIPLVTKSVPQLKSIRKMSDNQNPIIFIPTISVLFSGLPFFNTDKESPEDKLITTIKRSILCIQKEEYVKGEQMLHLALRMAQDLQHKDGITYIYDLMANLAMEQEQFPKAEKLFAEVMKRLFADGYKEDDIKVLHISLKLAHMCYLQENLEKAKIGFEWTLGKIEENMKNLPDDPEIKELWGLAQNWFGQCLMEGQKCDEAKKCFLNAYSIYVEKYGKINQEAITMLNNLSVACSNLGDLSGAKKYLEEAVEAAKQLPDSCELGILQANLGLLYLQTGLVDQAKTECMNAWKKGRKCSHKQTIEQAEYCLEKVKAFKV